MRFPVDVRWHQDLVYNAVWSLLVEIRRWNVEHLAPGPGLAHRQDDRASIDDRAGDRLEEGERRTLRTADDTGNQALCTRRARRG